MQCEQVEIVSSFPEIHVAREFRRIKRNITIEIVSASETSRMRWIIEGRPADQRWIIEPVQETGSARIAAIIANHQIEFIILRIIQQSLKTLAVFCGFTCSGGITEPIINTVCRSLVGHFHQINVRCLVNVFVHTADVNIVNIFG